MSFSYLEDSSDFGFAMRNAVSIDLAATAERYRALHATWPERVDAEVRFLDTQRPDLVLTDVAYLPLAAAARVGLPAMSMCSLNWADLFAHFFGGESWAAPIHAEMLAAYCSAARFLVLDASHADARASIPRPLALWLRSEPNTDRCCAKHCDARGTNELR